MGGSIFPTEPHPAGDPLCSLAGAPSDSSLLEVHPLTSLGGPSHSLAPVSHAKSPAGQGGPTGHVQDVVGVQLRELAFSGSHPAALSWKGLQVQVPLGLQRSRGRSRQARGHVWPGEAGLGRLLPA